MLAHKLVLDDIADHPFKLIALHCSVEEYKLAYLLNKHLDLRLARARKDIDYQVRSGKVYFALYSYNDQLNYRGYYLISNSSKGENQSSAKIGSLFGEEEMALNRTFLLPEFKKVDYFLKIEEEPGSFSERKMLTSIKEIPQIATAYLIDEHQIKSKENLIFD